MTGTAVNWLSVVPSPSWPEKLAPQHWAAPPVVSAQLWPTPTVIDATPVSSPKTGVGVKRLDVEPSPSWPKKLPPQHRAAPSVVTAQVLLLPMANAATPLDSPKTSTGVSWSSARTVADLAEKVGAPAFQPASRRPRAAGRAPPTAMAVTPPVRPDT